MSCREDENRKLNILEKILPGLALFTLHFLP